MTEKPRNAVVGPRWWGDRSLRYSLALVTAGLAADGVAGWEILRGEVLSGLLLHLPAVMVWTLGICRLQGQTPQGLTEGSAAAVRPVRTAPTRWPRAGFGAWNGWTLTGAVLTLVLFPGPGALGCSVGFAIARLLHKREGPHPRDAGKEDYAARRPTAKWATNPLIDLQVQPLAEILYEPDVQFRRAAVGMLCRQARPQAIPVLRRLLTDADPDVQTLAVAGMSRLQDDLSRALDQAAAQVANDPSSAESHADLARIYREYAFAYSGEDQGTPLRDCLLQARAAIHKAIAIEGARPDLWLDLARVEHDLGSGRAAWQAVGCAIELRPDGVEGTLLGMEWAFEEANFEIVRALARQSKHASIDDPETQMLLRWWAVADPEERAVRT